MNLRGLLRTIVVTGIVVAASVPALGQVNPPPWWGANDGNTTSQSWTFDDPSAPFVPDFVVNPFGAPGVGTSGNVIYELTALGRNGVMVMRDGGTLFFQIPNERRLDWIKQCWLQFDYAIDGSGFFDITAPGSTLVNWNRVDEPYPGTPWSRVTVTFDFVPQPDSETLMFTANPNSVLFIDNVHFGTHCVVPEPATMAALGLGAAALLRRRRK